MPCIDLVNSWVKCRRMFKLQSIPRRCEIIVTADSRYRLYVNDRIVEYGPARGYQATWPFDRVDIAPFLRKGTNVIAALVHNYGVSSFQYLSQTWAGFLLSGKIGSLDFSTGPDWKVMRAQEYGRHTARLSIQLGFEEFYDARKADNAWLKPEYKDTDWESPFCQHVGVMPWFSLEETMIPKPDKKEFWTPRRQLSVAAGKSHPMFQTTENPVDLYFREKPQWRLSPQPIKTSRGFGCFTLPAAKDKNHFHAVTVEFDHEVVGRMELHQSGGGGGEIVDILGFEAHENGKPAILSPHEGGSYVAMANRIILANGRTVFHQFGPWGFRYLIFILRNSTRPIRAELKLHSALYPLNITGSFECSNSRLNDIYKMSVRTQRCCMMDAYIDCPWREQVQWWGDARVQGANTFTLSGDTRLLERGIRQLSQQKVPNGLLYGHAPTMAHTCILPDFNLIWICTLWDYYRQTGDVTLFQSMQGTVEGIIRYFESMEEESGLARTDRRYWTFIDWCDMFKDGYSTVYNLLYLDAITSIAKLYEAADDHQLSGRYRTKADRLSRSIVSKLYNPKKDEFYGGLTDKGKPVVQNVPHAYALAILCDLLSDKHKKFLDTHLLPVMRNGERAAVRPSPYFSYYIFKAAQKMGAESEVIRSIEKDWGQMLDRGLSTTEEVWNARPGWDSLCHAWSAHPIVHFHEIILGIRQADVRWNKIEFAPCFDNLDYARGKTPTPHGMVEVQWEKKEKRIKVQLRLPKGMECKPLLPGVSQKLIGAGRHTWIIPEKSSAQ